VLDWRSRLARAVAWAASRRPRAEDLRVYHLPPWPDAELDAEQFTASCTDNAIEVIRLRPWQWKRYLTRSPDTGRVNLVFLEGDPDALAGRCSGQQATARVTQLIKCLEVFRTRGGRIVWMRSSGDQRGTDGTPRSDELAARLTSITDRLLDGWPAPPPARPRERVGQPLLETDDGPAEAAEPRDMAALCRELTRALHDAAYGPTDMGVEQADFRGETGTRRCRVRWGARAGAGRNRLAVITVNYRSVADTIRCVESVRVADGGPYDHYLIDNQSGDRSFRELVRRYPELTVVETQENIGFAAAVNLAVSDALEKGYEYLLLLNPDTDVPRSALADLLTAADSHPGAQVMGCTILLDSLAGPVWYAGGKIDWALGLEVRHCHSGQRAANVPHRPFETDYVTGACLLARADAFHQVGLLPEEYFLYFEETDWCHRARQAGLRLMVFPHVRIVHYKRSSSRGVPTPYYVYYYTRGRLLMCRKYRPDCLAETVRHQTAVSNQWLQAAARISPELAARLRVVRDRALRDGQVGTAET
jgi:GT2 family glycosyltransferase